MFGHEMLTSIASIRESSNFFVTAEYSSIVEPHTFAKKHVSEKFNDGRISLITISAPGFCSPIELSIPMGVSQTL